MARPRKFNSNDGHRREPTIEEKESVSKVLKCLDSNSCKFPTRNTSLPSSAHSRTLAQAQGYSLPFADKEFPPSETHVLTSMETSSSIRQPRKQELKVSMRIRYESRKSLGFGMNIPEVTPLLDSDDNDDCPSVMESTPDRGSSVQCAHIVSDTEADPILDEVDIKGKSPLKLGDSLGPSTASPEPREYLSPATMEEWETTKLLMGLERVKRNYNPGMIIVPTKQWQAAKTLVGFEQRHYNSSLVGKNIPTGPANIMPLLVDTTVPVRLGLRKRETGKSKRKDAGQKRKEASLQSTDQLVEDKKVPQTAPAFTFPPGPLGDVVPTLTPLRPPYYSHQRVSFCSYYDINELYQREKGKDTVAKSADQGTKGDNVPPAASTSTVPPSSSSHTTPNLTLFSPRTGCQHGAPDYTLGDGIGEPRRPWPEISFNTLHPTSDVRSEPTPDSGCIPATYSTLQSGKRRRTYASSVGQTGIRRKV